MAEYISPDEAAKYAGVDRSYLMNMCRPESKGKKVRFYRPSPRKTLFLRADLDAWLASWLTPDNARK